ncbi:hypothetical protein BDV35DRAFT_180234 [Aspergillus flavus]|uniref:Uncharacterized protein n=1 Tax=Aspergillus flavus TaxID=5059 RepID=A0A5N6H2B9_ASPFL|nr:hypothetical protein BDV35DRAFT_180234 [Aspergillus flavus]
MPSGARLRSRSVGGNCCPEIPHLGCVGSAEQPTARVQYGQLMGMADEVSWGTLGDYLSYLLQCTVCSEYEAQGP